MENQPDGTVLISQLNGQDAPELVTILLQAALFKLGGQMTVFIPDMNAIIAEFEPTRIAVNVPAQTITLTLRTPQGRVK